MPSNHLLPDDSKQRREFLRWLLLLGLYNGMPIAAHEEALLMIVQGIYEDASKYEVRVALEYLDMRGLVKLTKNPDGRWIGKLTREGIDVVEYSVDIEPGIARPTKCG